jgi:hypothetical protein
MKIKKSYLEKIIKEELNYLIIEESVELEEGWKEKMAGLAAGAAMMTGLGGTAQAAPKAPRKAPAAITAKAEAGVSDDVKLAAIGILQGYVDERVDEFGIAKIQANLMGAKDFITSLQKGKDYKGPELSKEEERVKNSAIEVVKKYKAKDPEKFKKFVAKGEKVKIS